VPHTHEVSGDPIALRADSLTKRYGSIVALDAVSVEVARGECVAFVGESGAGKTTLLRCFNRMVEPDAGDVVVDGVAVRSTDPIALRRHIGYVPQDGGLLPHWSVRRNVGLVPWLRGEPDREAADAALALVGLPPDDFGERRPRELSGGQRQRVAIARALVNSPSILLADEPTGNLDSGTSTEIMALFDQLHAQGQTIVLVTHEHDIAAHARRQVHLLDGTVERDFATEGTA
jgi:ABC-type proline/glycine betaine transport system ATPase subunit